MLLSCIKLLLCAITTQYLMKCQLKVHLHLHVIYIYHRTDITCILSFMYTHQYYNYFLQLYTCIFKNCCEIELIMYKCKFICLVN